MKRLLLNLFGLVLTWVIWLWLAGKELGWQGITPAGQPGDRHLRHIGPLPTYLRRPLVAGSPTNRRTGRMG